MNESDKAEQLNDSLYQKGKVQDYYTSCATFAKLNTHPKYQEILKCNKTLLKIFLFFYPKYSCKIV
jgi:hypothetical protein